MSELFLHALTAASVFIVTNVDDLVVLTVLFLAYRAKSRPRAQDIVIGQYLGIGILTALSLLAAFGLGLVPVEWVGLLGFVPLGLGVFGLIKAYRERKESVDTTAPLAVGLLGVASITIANGADNITVYTPLFHNLGPSGISTTLIVFTVLTGVWCVLAAALGSHKRLVAAMSRFGQWIVPAVFVIIGAVILSHAF